MTDQTIAVSTGAIEYCYPRTITETKGKDISTDTIQVSLGSYDAPATWNAPSTLTRPTTSSAVVSVLIGSAVAPGDYYLWTRISDVPEVVPRRSPGRIIVT